jgi:hypothetical protein
MQQYLHGPTGHGAARSRLQIILNSITDHFLELVDAYANPRQLNVVATDLDEIPAQTEEEYEERVEEKARRHRSAQQRVKRLLKGFIGRYLRGIRRADFQQVAGYEVMAQNYIIFSHILWRLFAKDWVEHAFVVTALLDTWAVFWGEGEQSGYLASLSQDQRTQVYAWMRFHHSDAEMLAALYYSARVADMERLDETRVRLRDFCRAFLSHPPYEITGEIIEEMWLILAHVLPLNPPLPTTVVREWTTLARVETREGFCHMLAKKYGYPAGSWLFSEAKVYRPSLRRQTRTDCLVLRARDASLDEETAVAIVQEWMRFENRDYYRISTPSTEQFNTMLYYDVIDKKGIYWAKSRGEGYHVLDPITPLPAAWDTTLSQIMARARQVDAVVRTTGAHSTVA